MRIASDNNSNIHNILYSSNYILNSYGEDVWTNRQQQQQQQQQQQRQQQKQQDQFPLYRWLGSDEDDYRIDYSVLSVAVITLGLLMIVELMRHRLQHAARGRPFFCAVLESVYTELATLGIVEVCLHIMTKQCDAYNEAKKEVFADVHFLLFYTAIFNAFQSCLLAALSTRISGAMWVTTEALEFNHYVEIREEFESVKDELEMMKQRRMGIRYNKRNVNKRERNGGIDNEDRPAKGGDSNNNMFYLSWQKGNKRKDEIVTTHAEKEFQFSSQGLFDVWQLLVDRIRYPRIKRRYNALLVQVRFHELRISFLKAYKMPLQLRISDYLVRCEREVLIRLTHVSSVAWFLLTGAINLVYYILGIVSYYMKDPELVGTLLVWIYFSSMMLFVILGWLTYNKMKAIFRSMMNDKHLWDVSDYVSDIERAQLSQKQMSMFWGSDPNFVISVIQFMQFGYAISLSTVIVFWEEISDGSVHMSLYVVVLFVCYAGFLKLSGQVIPRFTMCTSLAQMVNTKLLRETLAAYQLEEEKRKQKEHVEFLAYKGEIDDYIPLQKNDNNRQDDDKSVTSHNQHEDPAFVGGGAGTVKPVRIMENNKCPPVDVTYSNPNKAATVYDNSDKRDKIKPMRNYSGTLSNHHSLTSDSPGEKSNPTYIETSTLHSLCNPLDNSQLPKHHHVEVTTPRRKSKSISERVAFMTKTDTCSLSIQKNKEKELSLGFLSQSFDSVKPVLGTQHSQSSTGFSIEDQSERFVHSHDYVDMTETTSEEILSRSVKEKNHVNAQKQVEICRVRRLARKSLSDGVTVMAKLHTSNDFKNLINTKLKGIRETKLPATLKPHIPHNVVNKMAIDSADMMAELVRKDTRELRGMLPALEKQRRVLPVWEKGCEKRIVRRVKTASDGVLLMRTSISGNSSLPTAAEFLLGQESLRKITAHDDFNVGNEGCSNGLDVGVIDVPFKFSKNHNCKQGSQRICASRSPSHIERFESVSDGVALMARISAVDHGAVLVDNLSVSATRMEERNIGATFPMVSLFPTAPTEQVLEIVSGISLPSTIPMGDSQANHTTMLKDKFDDPDRFESEDFYSDGYYSDAGDIPDPNHFFPLKPIISNNWRLSVKERLRRHFSSKRYIIFSNIFGTTSAFFMVAKRVETFLHLEEIVSENFVTFGFPQSVTFWLLFCWLSSFICGDSLIFYSMSPVSSPLTNKEKQVVVAALLDIVLNAVCLIIFAIAESKRCCHTDGDESQRLLADTTIAELDYNDVQGGETSGWTDNEEICSCPAFGLRSYGGLGTIEPYVSLMGLRVLRHYTARIICGKFWNENKSRQSSQERNLPHKTSVNPYLVVVEKGHGHAYHGEHEEELVGTIAQLWEAAIVKHPEIVSQYGEFSGELLRAMLGVSLIEKTTEDSPQKVETRFSTSVQPLNLVKSEESEGILAVQRIKNKKANRYPISHSPTAAAQNISELSPVDNDLVLETGRKAVPEADVPVTSLGADFSSPNACLVRSMRRCERKLLPIINKWIVVDVVMTQFEMVYFEVVACDENAQGSQSETMKQALVVTKGGKQKLRLCDVARGRRVVGHLQFSDIQSVHVDRYMPGSILSGQHKSPDVEIKTSEYWIDSSNPMVPQSMRRSSDWEAMKQDVLRIQTGHGPAIWLRFYSDLEEGLRHPSKEDELFGDIFKNNAFLWAQTIGRLCGPLQLQKQSLPHFGDETANELRDYLVLHHRKLSQRNSLSSFCFSLRRVQSVD